MVKREVKLIGHVIHHNEFLQDIFEGGVMGRRPRGRTRLDDYFRGTIIKGKTSCTSYQHLKEEDTATTIRPLEYDDKAFTDNTYNKTRKQIEST